MGLRKIVDNMKPTFSKGGKLSFLASTFDAFETFLFVPDTTTTRGSHIRDCNDMKRTMIVVVLALLPAFLFGCYNTGSQVGLAGWTAFFYGLVRILPMVATSYIVGLAIEFYFAQIRGHEVNEGFLVSGLLIPMIMPVSTPLWMVALGTAFAVVFGKEVFGGTGMNIFNVALVTRAFLFFSYPQKMSGDSVWIATDKIFGLGNTLPDGFTAATPLGVVGAGGSVPFNFDMVTGFIPGSIGETSVIAIAIGAVILLWTGIASWKTMLSVFVGGSLVGFLFQVNGTSDLMWYEHLVLGGFAFGAVFMATDPVTSARTECGKWIYGFLIGAMAVLIRVMNLGFPEGMMLAILLMNMFAPLIDYCVVQRNISKRMNRIK